MCPHVHFCYIAMAPLLGFRAKDPKLVFFLGVLITEHIYPNHEKLHADGTEACLDSQGKIPSLYITYIYLYIYIYIYCKYMKLNMLYRYIYIYIIYIILYIHVVHYVNYILYIIYYVKYMYYILYIFDII